MIMGVKNSLSGTDTFIPAENCRLVYSVVVPEVEFLTTTEQETYIKQAKIAKCIKKKKKKKKKKKSIVEDKNRLKSNSLLPELTLKFRL
jgi:hypothetical protein